MQENPKALATMPLGFDLLPRALPRVAAAAPAVMSEECFGQLLSDRPQAFAVLKALRSNLPVGTLCILLASAGATCFFRPHMHGVGMMPMVLFGALGARRLALYGKGVLHQSVKLLSCVCGILMCFHIVAHVLYVRMYVYVYVCLYACMHACMYTILMPVCSSS